LRLEFSAGRRSIKLPFSLAAGELAAASFQAGTAHGFSMQI
jgi:hypothetical protein